MCHTVTWDVQYGKTRAKYERYVQYDHIFKHLTQIGPDSPQNYPKPKTFPVLFQYSIYYYYIM